MTAYDLKMAGNGDEGYVHLYFDPNIWIEGTQPWKTTQYPIGSQIYQDNHTLEERYTAYRSMIKIGRNVPTKSDENKEEWERYRAVLDGYPKEEKENRRKEERERRKEEKEGRKEEKKKRRKGEKEKRRTEERKKRRKGKEKRRKEEKEKRRKGEKKKRRKGEK